MQLRHLTVAFSLLAATASSVAAQAINGRSTGITSPQQTIDFESLAAGSQPGVVGLANFGGTWTVGGPFVGGSSFATNGAYNFDFSNCCTNPMNIWFTQAVNAAAFNIVTNPGTTVFTAFLGGSQVAQFSAATQNDPTTNGLWYGFENISFDQIQIDASATVNAAMGIDNLQANAVPEPGSIALVATGLLGVIGMARRRRLS